MLDKAGDAEDNVPLPRALFEIIMYFCNNPKHLELEGLFRKCGSAPVIDRINTHLFFCDYLILKDPEIIEQPHEVANYMKEILR